MEHAELRHTGYDESADAWLDGAWSAIFDVNGGWDRNVEMPSPLKKILCWHPYFWGWVFRGKFFTYALRHLIKKNVRK